MLAHTYYDYYIIDSLTMAIMALSAFLTSFLLLVVVVNHGHSFSTIPVLSNVLHSTTTNFALSAVSSAQSSIFEFQGHEIYTEITKPSASGGMFSAKKPQVILIHGFACSTVYWRETVSALKTAGYTVHALDLLGQGKSAKPGKADGIVYSINLWAELVDEYARKNVANSDEVVVMGNSLGSLVALAAATGDFVGDSESSPSYIRQRIKGICMFNCGIGMNSRNIIKEFDGGKKILIEGLFNLLDALIFGNIALLTYVLDKVVTKELLRDVLVGMYKCAPNPEERVDDELVDSFYNPAKQEGSVEALSQIYTNNPGATPMEVHARHKRFLENLPIHLVWGNQDGVTPLAGSVGRFYTGLADADAIAVTLDVVNSGHVPFDEIPEVTNVSTVRWLDEVVMTGTAKKEAIVFGGLKLPF
jgi:pimeloyl-ACP methyl ester carboxylesterase